MTENWQEIGIYAAIGAGIGAGLIILCTIVMRITGFGRDGVLRGSVAAEYQAVVGDVNSGSCFACLQSISTGRTLLRLLVAAIIGAAIGAVIGALVILFD